MKRNFTKYVCIGLLLASLISFFSTKDIYLPTILLWIALQIIFWSICIYIDIIIHEFGHAIAGWIVGFPIKKITIGFGRNIFKYKFKETTLVINQGIQGGLTSPGTFSPNFLRLRYFFFTLGGVGLQGLVILLVTIIMTALKNPYTFAIPNTHNFLVWKIIDSLVNIFLYTNYILIFLNLIPMNINIMGIPMPNDGLQLLTIFFVKQQRIKEILLSGKIMEGMEYLEDNKFPEAELTFRECIEQNPQFLIPKINLSATLIRQQKIDEAITLLSNLISESEDNPGKLLIFNNLAWSYLLKSLNQPDLLNLADDYSTQALKISNQSPAVVGTRSCILIEMGKLEEGIKLLKPYINLNHPVNETTNSGIGFLYLAYAYYLQGNKKECQKYWQKIQNNQDLQSSEYQLLFNHVVNKTNSFN